MLKYFITALCLSGTALVSAPVSFNSGWSIQKLSFFSNNKFSFGNTLSMHSDSSVSIAWTRLPQSEWASRTASWTWAVTDSVPATSLKKKGGDDRNLALYFVFAPKAQAQDLKNANIRQLLGNKSVRVLLYTWGGKSKRGSFFESPYLKGQGINAILRPAGTGTFKEHVKLDKDYKRAFGSLPETLLGIAVSGDSDDTDSTINATISKLTLK